MRGHVDDLTILLGNIISTTFYLEKDTIPAFIGWLTADPLRRPLIASTWKIVVFKRHIASYGDYRSRRNGLTRLGIEVNPFKLKEYDSLFLEEVERTYFTNSGADHRQLAEFYLLVRRTEGNGWINVISQDRSFERIPMVNTYFIGTELRTGNQDLPAQFDYIGDMAIHRELARAVASRLDDPNRGDVMINATLALRDHIRLLSGLPEDGRNLMERAFKQDGQYLKVNPLVTQPDPHFQSHQNEQIGFRELYCGVFTGLRNSLVHEGPGSAFAQTRYPDKVTLLKYLSLLSLLFERADSPFP